MATDGARYFFTGFEGYPVTDGEGFIARTLLPRTILKKFTLGVDGKQISSTDVTTGQVTFSTQAAGVVAIFQNELTGNNCAIDPSVVGGISCSSDGTLKKDVESSIDSQLDKVSQLRPVEYHWKNQNDADSKTIGFIAQDIQKIFPEFVTTDPDTGKLRMSYTGLIIPLVKAMQELNQKIQQSEIIYALQDDDKETLATLLENSIKKIDELFANTINAVSGIFENIEAKRVSTEELCMGDICITADQFQTVFGDIAVQKASTTPDPAKKEKAEVKEEGPNTKGTVDIQASSEPIDEKVDSSEKEAQVTPKEDANIEVIQKSEEQETIERTETVETLKTVEPAESEKTSLTEIIARLFSRPKVLARL
jgi:hypothetical protein